MKTPTEQQHTDIRTRADAILGHIDEAKGALDAIQKEAAARVAAVAVQYETHIVALEKQIDGLEEELVSLSKANKDLLFHDTDKVDLPHGIIIYQLKKRVKHARCVLKRLKAQGFTGEIKTAESVDWDKLEKWTDDQLAAVGAKRVEEEHYEYELKR